MVHMTTLFQVVCMVVCRAMGGNAQAAGHGAVVNSSEKYVDHSPLSQSLPLSAVIHSLRLATILAPHGIGKGNKSEGNMGHPILVCRSDGKSDYCTESEMGRAAEY